MAHRRRPNYYSAEEATILFWGRDNDSSISEDEEAELEHHLQVFSEESRYIRKRSINCDPKLSLCGVTRASACLIFLGYLNFGYIRP